MNSNYSKKLEPFYLIGLLLYISVSFGQQSNAKKYYVNDTDDKGDVYTTNLGNDTNDGLSPQNPKQTLKAAYAVAKSGDIIYLDTGIYEDIDAKGNLTFENAKKIQIVMPQTVNVAVPKTPLPTVDKSTPEDFYIIDDKPVSKELYMKHLQQSSKKQ